MTLERMNRLISLITRLRPLAIAGATILTLLTGWLAVPQTAEAYPFWAQENYETPREATGRIVCANCHLAAKPTKVEVPQAVLPDSVFKLTVEIPYDLDTQQVLGDGSKGGLNVGAVVVLPEGFKIAPPDRISEELQEEVGSTYFLPYSDTQEISSWLVPYPVSSTKKLFSLCWLPTLARTSRFPLANTRFMWVATEGGGRSILRA
jgi:apocytochrome f